MNDNEKIYIKWRYLFVGGLLAGMPLGSLLGQWTPLAWLPLGAWATYRVWKDQQ